MIKWYKDLHPWNRVTFTSVLVVIALPVIAGDLTIERMMATPLVSTVMWACGWATISGSRLVRRVRS